MRWMAYLMFSVAALTAWADIPCPDCGVVTEIHERTERHEPHGAGAALGGLLGAIAGHEAVRQDRLLLAVLGAIAGAIAGHEIEWRARTVHVWEATVKMDDGSVRILSQEFSPVFAAGDRVRVEDGVILLVPQGR